MAEFREKKNNQSQSSVICAALGGGGVGEEWGVEVGWRVRRDPEFTGRETGGLWWAQQCWERVGKAWQQSRNRSWSGGGAGAGGGGGSGGGGSGARGCCGGTQMSQ